MYCLSRRTHALTCHDPPCRAGRPIGTIYAHQHVEASGTARLPTPARVVRSPHGPVKAPHSPRSTWPTRGSQRVEGEDGENGSRSHTTGHRPRASCTGPVRRIRRNALPDRRGPRSSGRPGMVGPGGQQHHEQQLPVPFLSGRPILPATPAYGVSPTAPPDRAPSRSGSTTSSAPAG
jgi:hypothetical protein